MRRFIEYFCGTAILVSCMFNEFGEMGGSITAGLLVAMVGVTHE